MYDDNKWNEAEKKETMIEGTAQIIEDSAEEGSVGTAAEATSEGHAEEAAASQSVQPTQKAEYHYVSQEPEVRRYSQGNQASQPQNYGPGSQSSDGNLYGRQPNGQYRYRYDQKTGENQSNPNGGNHQYRSQYEHQQPYNNYYQNQNGNRTQSYYNGNGNTPKKKGSFLKKALMVTAAALLFGVVSGATMFGVNRAGELLFPMETQAQVQTQPALENTEVIPVPQQTQEAVATGVVLEDVSLIVEAAMPSVVAINNTTLYQSSTWFGQTQTYEVPSSGSGIIIGENETELLIVTNNHVIEDSNTLSVTFIDESTVDAAIKGTDSASDLAVIAVPLENIAADTRAQIKAATLGDSDSLKMGQGVIAIGNALGHGQSVTVGHVSALDREIEVDGNVRTVIQTDAAINPGNSGGALLNAKGELIGINEAKYADETVEGIGYAIPISYAKDIIEDLKLRTTKVEVAESEQGYLGIQVQNVDAATAQMLGMPQGVYVYKIMEDSAAAASDLREKDIITKFDGEKVSTNADLTTLLTYYKAGSTVTLTVQSLENGTYVEREVEITLKNRPQEEETETSARGQRNPRP